MTAAEDLRRLADPAFPAAALAGAEALDDRPRLLATIAGLETTVAQLTARIRQLELELARPATYTVVAGDTLSKIGLRFGLDWRDIVAWNGLTSTGIRPGQILRLTPPTRPPSQQVPPSEALQASD